MTPERTDRKAGELDPSAALSDSFERLTLAVIKLRDERDALRARCEALEKALRRLGSMEAFGSGGVATEKRWAEEGPLRMDFARAALSQEGEGK